MTRSLFAGAALLAAAALSGCATTAAGPVEVTRFARPEFNAAARGPITITPGPASEGNSFEFGTFAGAVSRELQRVGYTQGQGGDTYAVVELHRQTYRNEGSGRGPVSVGVGGSTGGWSSGVGLGLGFNLGGGPKAQVQTELAVSIRERGSGRSIWEGKARFLAPQGSPLANADAAAAKMAQALFQGFPGQSGETILVK